MPAIETPPAEPATRPAPGLPEGQVYRFSADDFTRMVESDVFPEGSRVGLWDGLVYEKMAKKQAYAVAGNKLLLALIHAMPAGWFPGVENPILLGPGLLPLPDLVVLRGDPDAYRHRIPQAADVGLVVAVADSSLRDDTSAKLAAYARAGVSSYWVVNLVANVVQVYENPIAPEGRYATQTTYAPGESIPLTLGGVTGPVAASDILPQP